MEITNDAPAEYVRFTLVRLFWRELGKHYDEMSVREVHQTAMFLEMEAKHPHRFTKKAAE